uniref:NADH dehydrogenase subunit 6 n=1 Tax=Poecilasma litum TaxID=2358225 RepID=UPI0021CC8DF8|nr:NADH dehydrogenase subunit 6 [Poecilasma litum]UWM12905.1 NADH dehydrogenase subunit 6 [Poecilasma litum]
MMKLFILLIFFANMIFMFTFHPLAMIFTLIIQSIFISISLFTISQFPWFSYTLILVFLGGMLILFTYMANIASNEKFAPNMKFLFLIPVIMMITLLTPKLKFNTSTDSSMFKEENFMGMVIMKPYEMNMLPLIIIMASLIILTLLAVVKISKMNKGALRVH